MVIVVARVVFILTDKTELQKYLHIQPLLSGVSKKLVTTHRAVAQTDGIAVLLAPAAIGIVGRMLGIAAGRLMASSLSASYWAR
jgi:hypothetical protein